MMRKQQMSFAPKKPLLIKKKRVSYALFQSISLTFTYQAYEEIATKSNMSMIYGFRYKLFIVSNRYDDI